VILFLFIPSVFFSSLLCLKSAHERRLFTTPDLATEETSNFIKKNMHLRANQLIDADMRLIFSEESESSHLEPKLLGRAVFGL